MEGVLYTRDGRSKLLRSWHKRYFVLSDTSGLLREYSSDTRQEELLSRTGRASSSSSGRSNSSSGMTLCRELNVRGAAVKTLPFPVVGKPNAFQVTILSESASSVSTSRSRAMKLILSARQAEEGHQWMAAVRSVALRLTIPRRLASPMEWSGHLDSDLKMETQTDSDDFLEVKMPQRTDMALLSSVYEWVRECCVKTSQSVTVAGVHIPRGSLLVSANGVSLQTLTSVEVKKLLLESTGPLPVSLQFLKAPAKCGILRAKLYTSPLTQLKSLARYRKSSRTNWKEQLVDLSGDLLTCQLQVKTPMSIGNHKKTGNTGASHSKTKRVLLLSGGSSVKPVHELVSDRKYCFMVTVDTHSMLFHARSESDRRAWTDAVQRAITIAGGLIPGGSFGMDALQLQSSMNMRHLEHAFEGMQDGQDVTYHANKDNANDEKVEANPLNATLLLPSEEDWISATQLAAYLPDNELTEMLRVLQSSGRFIEALQLMQKNTALRSKYWHQIFQWALAPACSIEENLEHFQQLVSTPLSEEYVLWFY